MSDTLKNRLRGIYQVGPNADTFGTRSFADFIPRINLEAADHIEKLEDLLEFNAALLGRAAFSNHKDNVLREQFFKSLVDYSDKIDN